MPLGAPKNRKMSQTTKTVNCPSLTHLSYWWQVDTISSIFIFPGVNFKTLLIHVNYILEVVAFNGVAFNEGGEGVISFMNYWCFHASTTRMLTINLLLANQIVYYGHFWGVMKIRFSVTLAVLGLLRNDIQYMSILHFLNNIRSSLIFFNHHKLFWWLVGILLETLAVGVMVGVFNQSVYLVNTFVLVYHFEWNAT